MSALRAEGKPKIWFCLLHSTPLHWHSQATTVKVQGQWVEADQIGGTRN
jgi:hypothetical protein